MLASTKMSNLNMLIFYCVCGYIGNIFGAICDSNGALFVGSLAASYGMFSGMISCLIVNWHALAAVPQIKCPLIMIMVMFSIMLMLNSAGNRNFSSKYHVH